MESPPGRSTLLPLFQLLDLIHKRRTEEDIYLIDSLTAKDCDIRISKT
ncbi:hypothetical protein GGP91_002111 [Salinibacter ruber]|nr:hypothetical protein [Salinibacter ruber]